MRKLFKNEIGITLVALIITIVILLILAGITIALLTENGLFEKAKLAKEKQENAQIKEDETLVNYETKLNEYVGGIRSENLKESTLIKNVDFNVKDCYLTEIEIEVIVDAENSSDAVVYYVFCNGKVVTGQSSNTLIISNLQENTEYSIKCGIIDVDGNVKISEEKKVSTKYGIIIYDKGILNTSLVGNWQSSGNSNQKQTINTADIYFYNTAYGSYSNKIFWLDKKVDMSEYDNLVIEWKVNNRSMCIFGVTNNTPSFTDATNDNSGKTQYASYITGSISTDTVTQKVNIKDVNEGFIAFYMFDVKAYVYRMYFE